MVSQPGERSVLMVPCYWSFSFADRMERWSLAHILVIPGVRLYQLHPKIINNQEIYHNKKSVW